MRKIIFIQLVTLLCFWATFFGLQNSTIYSSTLGKVALTWQNEDGARTLVEKPYEKLTNDNYIQWDAVHYFKIKNEGYKAEGVGSDYIFAFFPMFPLIMKIVSLPPIGIFFLNYLFFSLSILLLLKLFSSPKNYFFNTMISLSLPSIIIFLIPYTEATYMLMVSIGIYGFVRKKYWIFFLGFLFASLTRPSFTFLLLSIIGAEFFFFIHHKNVVKSLKNTFLRISPLVLGTLTVSVIQYTQGSGSWFKFVEVQKYWQNILSIPHNLRDWSHESFGINIGVIFLLFSPFLVLFFQLFYRQIKKNSQRITEYSSAKDYLLILSIIYLIGNCLFILLFRGGSLHCLFRFTLCSPFFYLLLYIAFDYLRNTPLNFRFFAFSSLSILSIFILGLTNFSTYWNFSDFGLFVFIGSLAFWLFQDVKYNPIFRVGMFVLLLTNVVWTTYLFNTYIIDGWIFA